MVDLPEGVTPLSAWRRICLCATPPHPGVERQPSPPATAAPDPNPHPHPHPEPEPEPEPHGKANKKVIVMSCPEMGTLDPYGGPPYDQQVMDTVEELQQQGRLKFGFDRAGTSTSVEEDKALFDSGIPENVKKTKWFYGYVTAAKQTIKLEMQGFDGLLVLLCVEGGMVTQVEAEEMQRIVNDARKDAGKSHLKVRIQLVTMSYFDFLQEYATGDAGRVSDLEPYSRARHEKKKKPSPQADLIKCVPMSERKYDFFINHCQKSGQDQCRTLAMELRRRGCRVWYDMTADDLTAYGMEVGVSQSRNMLIFLSEDLMARVFCQHEQRWGIKYGCKFVGVVEKDERHGTANFGAEKQKAPQDLKFLLDEVEFLDYHRREYQLQALIEEVCRRGGCALHRAPVLSDVSDSDVVAEVVAHTCCLYLALQAPQKLIGEAVNQVTVRERLAEVELKFKSEADQWIQDKWFPVCLSDVSASTCDLRAQLKRGAVHCLVWCARGDGWEARAETQNIQTLGGVSATIKGRALTAAPPSVAIVCLRYGARKAAAQLLDAGITNVLWLTADMLSKDCADIVAKAVVPAVRYLEDGAEPDEVSKMLRSTLTKLAEDHRTLVLSDDSCGCISSGHVSVWAPTNTEDQQLWMAKLVPDAVNGTNMPADLADLNLLACDLSRLQEVMNKLRSCGKVSIVSTHEDTALANAAGRRRSIARDACAIYLRECKHVVRVTAAADLEGVTAETCLVWFDLIGSTTGEDVRSFNDRRATLPHQADVILTCDDAFASDAARVEEMDELDEELDLKEVDIGPELGLVDVHADDLVDDFKLRSSFAGNPSGQPNLLDVFDAKQLADVLQSLLDGRPVVGIYHADEADGIVFRTCVSDVAFLHGIRDQFLQNDGFGRKLEMALRGVPRKDGNESLGELKVEIDHSHFAERYCSSILRLDKLTPHQREKLLEIRHTDASVHVKAPAGAGKTFLALHQTLELLKADRRSTVLFVAPAAGLVLFVVHWIVERVSVDLDWGDKKLKKLLARLHLLHDSLADGPRVATVKNELIMTRCVEPCANYDLIVIDEAHHIYRDEQLRAIVGRYAGNRRMLLSDVSQGLHDGLPFPDDLQDIRLEEVVRCSKRVVGAARKFQQGISESDVRCHHESDGPPLKSLLYLDNDTDGDGFELCAAKTMEALEHVTSTFPTLNLNNRLGIIVPDAGFRQKLAPHLESQLARVYKDRFEMLDAAAASRICVVDGGGLSHSGKEHIVMDGVSQFDGMEFLVVVCVCLDTPKSIDGDQASTAAFAESRSRLYRGITRAHMLALAVNTFVPDGWLAYLSTVRLKEGSRFDAQEMARMSREQQARVDAESKRQQEHQATVETFVEARSLKSELSGEEFVFIYKKLLAAEKSEDNHLERVLATVRAEEWPRQCQLDRVPQLVAGLTSVGDGQAREYVGRLSSDVVKASPGASIVTAEEAIELTLGDWREAGAALTRVIAEGRLAVPDAEQASLQFHTASTCRESKEERRDVDNAARAALTKWQREEAVGQALTQLQAHSETMVMGATALRALQPSVRHSVVSGKSAAGAAAEALELWRATSAALQALAVERRVTNRQSWVQAADVLHSCVGLAGAALVDRVERGVAAWEERKRNELEQQKVEQSIWETSGNETVAVAEGSETTRTATLADDVAEPEPVVVQDLATRLISAVETCAGPEPEPETETEPELEPDRPASHPQTTVTARAHMPGAAMTRTSRVRVVKAKFPWNEKVGAKPTDLYIEVGSLVEVIEDQGDWLTGKLAGRTGIFPANYVEETDEELPDQFSEPRAATARTADSFLDSSSDDSSSDDSSSSDDEQSGDDVGRLLEEDIRRDERERLEAEQARLAAMDEQQRQVHDARQHITDELLTLRCPRCRTAFLDFEGCFALTCSHCQPKCGFCAWCLADCGADAHRHVATCAHNSLPGKGISGSLEDFQQAQLKRRKRLVVEFLRTIEDRAVRDQVVGQCRTDLEDLHMHDVVRQFAAAGGPQRVEGDSSRDLPSSGPPHPNSNLNPFQ